MTLREENEELKKIILEVLSKNKELWWDFESIKKANIKLKQISKVRFFGLLHQLTNEGLLLQGVEKRREDNIYYDEEIYHKLNC